jgi:hypothetical protein
MNKFFKLFGIIALVAVIGFSLAACGSDDDGGNTGGGGGETTTPGHTHQWGEWTIIKAVTCTEKGEKTRICTLDATHKETQEIAIDQTAHVWEQLAGVAPTCTTTGNGSRKCNICNTTETLNVIPALGHDFANWTQTTAPTCTTAGIETGTCARDGSTTTRSIPINTTAHNYGNWLQTKAPTCTTAGIDTRTCTHDVAHKETRTGAVALGHDWEWVVTTPASYTEYIIETKICRHDPSHKDGTRTIPDSKIPIVFTAVSNSTFGTDYNINAIAYGSNGSTVSKFVAVGGNGYSQGGKIAYSADGVTWTDVKLNSLFLNNNILIAITYGNGKFVAGGYSVGWSTDGVTWTEVSNSTFGNNSINAITYGSNGSTVSKFVAVGNSGKMAWSTDGITWTAVSNSTFGTSIIRTIAYGNGKFVAGGNSGKMATSTDGVTWTAVTNSTFGTSAIYTIAYGNGKFVAGISGDSKIVYSSDGVTWTAVSNSTFDSWINAISYGNGKFVAVGDSGKMAYWKDN